MGEHRSRAVRSVPSSRKTQMRPHSTHPDLPSNVGKVTSWKWNTGERHYFTILDELRRRQSTAAHKTIVLQKIRHETDGRIEFRLGYYMIGVKPRMAGRWTWGQHATLIPAKDFRALIRQAHQRKWI